MNRDKILWYANRVRSMPPQEILHRFREAFEQRRPLPSAATARPSGFLAPEPGTLRLLDVWSSLSSEVVSDFCLSQAQAALSGEISVFGHPWSTTTRHWNVDPVSGYEWPAVPAHKIDYRHSAPADPKWTWEVNRLLFLVPVAFAVQAGLIDRKSGTDLITATVTDWIEHCPVGRGPQWAASIEVAIRSIVMTLVAQAVEDPEPVFLKRVAESVRDHSNWIRRFPSAYSSANNHRVAEISAQLILDSSWVGVLSESERLRLEREVAVVSRALFSTDGIGLEQSPTYAGFSLEFLALVLHCRNWSSEQSRRQTSVIVSQASYALAQLTNEDGSLIRYGDDDEGKVVTVAVPSAEYAGSLARLCTGREGVRDQGVITFAEGGISVLRFEDGAAETTWTFDHGPLGFGAIAAHGHADALAVSLRSAGVDWVVDAGTYRYHGDKEWRTYFRSSKAHNSPQLDDLDSSVMTGDFNWDPQKRAQGKLLFSQVDGSRVRLQATHDGYLKQGVGAVLRTLERISDGHYRIVDSHDGDRRLSTGFMLNPTCNVKRTQQGWMISHPNSDMTIELIVSGHGSLRLERPEEQVAWFSRSFGVKVPTWRLQATASRRDSEPQVLNFDFIFSNSFHQEARQ